MARFLYFLLLQGFEYVTKSHIFNLKINFQNLNLTGAGEEGGRYTFLKKKKKKPCNFQISHFITLEIPEETSFPVQKPRSMNSTNYTRVFCEYLRKFYFFFKWPLKFPHALSSISSEIVQYFREIRKNLENSGNYVWSQCFWFCSNISWC